MTLRLNLKLEAFHKPTQKWHVYAVEHNVRAVSRRHALNKGLKVIEGWPGYADRQNHQDWDVEASAAILPNLS